ncbi:MAG: PhoU domain-containing protein [Candidatus Omnitrophota bacterium]
MMKSIDENFKFMILETGKQVQDVRRCLTGRDARRLNRMHERDDYIDTLNNQIQTKCFASRSQRSADAIEYLKALDTISRNLERIGDYAVGVVDQIRYIEDPQILDDFDWETPLKDSIRVIKAIDKAFFEKSVETALQICRAEHKIDEIYSHVLHEILRRLPGAEKTGDLLTCLFIFQYLERLGDALLNIGEAVLSMNMGEKIRINQYVSFKEVTDAAIPDLNLSSEDLVFRSLGETRSGCRINQIGVKDIEESGKKNVVFKDGPSRKIAREKESLDRWAEIAPGLTPRVLGFRKGKRDSSILLEFLAGRNFRDIVIEGSGRDASAAFDRIGHVVDDLWSRTIRKRRVQVNMVDQIRERIADVYTVHPDFRAPHYKIGALDVPSFEERLRSARQIEKELAAPFSVWTHGDFNLDNILFDQQEKQVHFLDVYRSGRKDYVQDVSVFIVSAFRLPVFEPAARRRIYRTIERMYEFARGFASRHHDATFQARLAFGLVRSFTTSTRFELDQEFAKDMMLRAFYLLEKITDHKGEAWEEFCIPGHVLTTA